MVFQKKAMGQRGLDEFGNAFADFFAHLVEAIRVQLAQLFFGCGQPLVDALDEFVLFCQCLDGSLSSGGIRRRFESVLLKLAERRMMPWTS